MEKRKAGVVEDLRIVWVIAAKDIVDALKNRTTLSNIVITLFVIAAYRVWPVWFTPEDLPVVLVYDAGDSSLAAALESSTGLRSVVYASRQVLMEKMISANQRELGLVIPKDFDQIVASGGRPKLEGHAVYWVGDQALTDLITYVEQELADLLGQPVSVSLQEERVYATPNSTTMMGIPYMAAAGLLIALAMVGMTVTPHLMFEEKQTRTLEVLLVSPARSSHIVLGKALTGLFYCLTCAAAVVVINTVYFHLWGMALLAATAGSLFCVAMGLLLGTLLDNRQQFTIWGFALMAILLMPVFLYGLAPILPDAVNAIVPWVPTVTVVKLAAASFGASLSVTGLMQELLYLLACTSLVLAAVAWLIRRSDR